MVSWTHDHVFMNVDFDLPILISSLMAHKRNLNKMSKIEQANNQAITMD